MLLSDVESKACLPCSGISTLYSSNHKDTSWVKAILILYHFTQTGNYDKSCQLTQVVN